MQTLQSYALKLKDEIHKIIIGKDTQLDLILMSVFCGGHILVNDLPGSGKTTLVRTLSLALGCAFRRIQFTPDLLPSDIIGMTVFNQKTATFETVKGPVHTNLLLADEINRALPRTQSALLEAMEEHQTTIDGKTFMLPEPFLVLATQNPVDRESTFMLPAAQTDRFFISITLGYPTAVEEQTILSRLGDGTPYEQICPVTNPSLLMQLKSQIKTVFVSDPIKAYIVDLVRATREHPHIQTGASPRASRSLYQGSKAYAAMQGRDYVLPEDVGAIFPAILRHRVVLSREARLEKQTEEGILETILAGTVVPPAGKELFK